MKVEFCYIEILGVFVVVVLNGIVLGGGWEIVLGCYVCIVLNDFKIKFGFLEVILGLLLGGGGIVCMVCFLGL